MQGKGNRGGIRERERERPKERKLVKVKKKFREKLCSAIKLLNCSFRQPALAHAHVKSSEVVKFMIWSRIIAI